MAQRKTYEYQTVVIEDRGFLDDPEFLYALNEQGANGWRHKEDQQKGSSQLCVLMERETVVDS
jgi:hypothetical protein